MIKASDCKFDCCAAAQDWEPHPDPFSFAGAVVADCFPLGPIPSDGVSAGSGGGAAAEEGVPSFLCSQGPGGGLTHFAHASTYEGAHNTQAHRGAGVQSSEQSCCSNIEGTAWSAPMRAKVFYVFLTPPVWRCPLCVLPGSMPLIWSAPWGPLCWPWALGRWWTCE